MRINLLNTRRGGASSALVKHLIKIAADEFLVDYKRLHQQLMTGYDPLGEAVATHLRSVGWQISWYKLPHPEADEMLGMSDYAMLSAGFVISDNCDLFISWRLQHGP